MDELIKLSLSEDDFSSHVQHKQEEVFTPNLKDYSIPEYFNVDRITILPVDPSKFFIYWMLSKEKIEKYKKTYPEIKLFVEDKEVLKTKVFNHYGDIYLHYHAPFKKVYAILTVDNDFMIRSNEIVAPSDVLSFEDEEVWFDKSNKIEKKIPAKFDKDHLNKILKTDERYYINTDSSKRR